MRLNPDCMRSVLIEMERADYRETIEAQTLYQSLPEYSEDDINYTISKLQEAGFIEATIMYADDDPYYISVSDITYDGHQFLANIRKDNVWSKVKNIAEGIGALSIGSISQIATAVVTELINKHLVLN